MATTAKVQVSRVLAHSRHAFSNTSFHPRGFCGHFSRVVVSDFRSLRGDIVCKVGKRPGQAVDLIDRDDVNLPGSNVSQEPLQVRTVGRSAGVTTVIVRGSHQAPAGMSLASYIRRRRLILRIEGVEVLIEGSAACSCEPGVAGRSADAGFASASKPCAHTYVHPFIPRAIATIRVRNTPEIVTITPIRISSGCNRSPSHSRKRANTSPQMAAISG